MNVKKISSIPGRLRLCIEGLKWNSNMAFNIEDILRDFSSIKCININTKTGNVLLFYDLYYIDEDMICSIISSSSIKIYNLANATYIEPNIKINSMEIFREIRSLCHGLLALSISMAAILLFTASPVYAISSLILGFPGILFLISYFSTKYTLIKAHYNNVYIKDSNSIKHIRNIKSISLHQNIVFNNDGLENLKSLNYFRIESFIATKKIKDPINADVRKLIKDLRSIGINNIDIISEYENSNLVLYANKSLGLYDNKKDQYPKIIIINENNFKRTYAIDNIIVIGISPVKLFYKNNISIICNGLPKISWFIKECIDNQEYLVRAQAIAVSINVVGIFLAFIRYLDLGGAILLYFLNSLGNLFFIKYNMLNNKK